MRESPTVLITLDGAEYRLRFRDITAIDAKDFRAKVGVALTQALAEGSTDLDVVAGLIWLVRRKTERSLPYEAVAQAVNYDSDMDLELATDPARTEDPTNPET